MKNKVIVLVIAMLLTLTSIAFAGNNNNQNNSDNGGNQEQIQGQAQGQLQGQAQGQLQGQAQAATAIQGQLGIVGQANKQATSQNVAVGGDTTKVYSASYPAVGATEGVSSGTASSLFGSLGLANTEQYKKLMPQIQVISALTKEGFLTQEEGQERIDNLVRRMIRSNKTQRFLGIFWETDTKSIMNLLGLLSWDSIWDEGQNPFQRKSDIGKIKVVKIMPKTEDKGITGNGGNVNK